MGLSRLRESNRLIRRELFARTSAATRESIDRHHFPLSIERQPRSSFYPSCPEHTRKLSAYGRDSSTPRGKPLRVLRANGRTAAVVVVTVVMMVVIVVVVVVVVGVVGGSLLGT